MSKIAIAVICIFSFFFSGAGEVNADENSVYKKIIVKSRAKRYKDTNGVSPASKDLYIYADDKEIEKNLDQIKNTPKSLKAESVNIVSPVIGKKANVRNVNVVVDAKKGIKVDRKRLGIKDDQEVNIASPIILEGAKVRDVDITVDAKRGGIEIK